MRFRIGPPPYRTPEWVEIVSALDDASVRFNGLSGLLVTIAMPFLPDGFCETKWGMPAVAAWLVLGNVIIRTFTKGAVFWPRSIKEALHGPPRPPPPPPPSAT